MSLTARQTNGEKCNVLGGGNEKIKASKTRVVSLGLGMSIFGDFLWLFQKQFCHYGHIHYSPWQKRHIGLYLTKETADVIFTLHFSAPADRWWMDLIRFEHFTHSPSWLWGTDWLLEHMMCLLVISQTEFKSTLSDSLITLWWHSSHSCVCPLQHPNTQFFGLNWA